jgi:hypothetical protein
MLQGAYFRAARASIPGGAQQNRQKGRPRAAGGPDGPQDAFFSLSERDAIRYT